MIDQVRRFNRVVTQRVGALNDEFLARERPLGQARLLWEIGADGSDLRGLRSRLDLDSGYLSRLLRALEADRLVVVEPCEADARVRTARLTDLGLAERAELDRRADLVADSILEPLSERQRGRLVAAMGEVERLLAASMVEISVTDPRDPDARFCLRSYFEELAVRFDAGYDPALGLPVSDAAMTPPAGLLLVARLHDEPVGCGALSWQAPSVQTADGSTRTALKFQHAGPAELKRMWVAPTARGLGLGRRLLTELEERAAATGARVVRLETNRNLTEAIGMYRATGYREVAAFNDEPYAHHWFEKEL